MTTLPVQPSLPLGVLAHDNQGLLADHYLNNPERLRALDEWKQAAGVGEAFQKIAQLYVRHAARFNKRANEAQTENDFIRPVLDLLWGKECYQVQVTIPNVDGRRQPDYAFFRTAADRQTAEPRLGTLDYWRDVPCLGDAKKWTASLDKERGADENPSAQICNYLYRSRVRWGILTNGRIWRLYEREKSSAGGVYYEVSLAELLQSRDLEKFKYFYFFFRREAFLPNQSGVSFVEKVFQGSVDYATEVGDRLKESVYDALRLLMNGFFEHSSNGLNRHDSDALKLVHENCLIILYRLLFLLYAEDRDLLPRKTEPYASYSLYRLQREINQHLREGKTYPPMSRRFWGELTNLFALIDEGFSKGGIPAYNGGLFSPSKYPHIAHTPQPSIMRWDIGDHRLAEVVDMLAYQRERWNEPGTQDIDYNTLEVQHLGSIYEGLLELQPQIADEPKVETLEDGKPVFKPARDVPNPRPIRGQPPRMINEGEIYLVTNRGERKATGSYYTPKYIVDYIVQNTIGPLADEAAKTVAELRPEVEKETAKLKRKQREWDKSSAPDAAEHIAGLNKLIEKQKRRLREPYLSLKILDPAMGSGHFLVGAADFLSLAMATDPNLLPLDEMGSEDPQAFYKRLVVERCLYGVDLNPLAVELAKLSLWLHTVSKDRALSFLDHHLRCGNSLIGASVADLSRLPVIQRRRRSPREDDIRQPSLFSSDVFIQEAILMLGDFELIASLPGDDARSVHEKQTIFDRMERERREKQRRFANLWVSAHFDTGIETRADEFDQLQAQVHTQLGLFGGATDIRLGTTQSAAFPSVTAGLYNLLAQAIREGKEREVVAAFQPLLTASERLARDKRFFHWELEFPEVFFDAYGFKPKDKCGFDAVIGNPPYDVISEKEQQREVDAEKFYFACTEVFSAAVGSKLNLYRLFIALSIGLLREGGQNGFIVPMALLGDSQAKPLRENLLRHYRLRLVEAFPQKDNPQDRVFFDAKLSTCLYVLERSETNTFVVRVHPGKYILDSSLGITISTNDLKQFDQDNLSIPCYPNMIEADFRLAIKLVVVSEGRRFGEWAPSQQGEVNLTTHAEFLSDEPVGPIVLRGAHVGRYAFNEEPKQGEPKHLLVEEFLSAHGSDTKAFDHRDVRIGYQRGAAIDNWRRIIATIIEASNFCSDTINYIAKPKGLNLLAILAVLNSSLWEWRFRLTSTNNHVNAYEIDGMPFRCIGFRTPVDERARLLEKGKRLYERCLSKGNNDCVLGFVQHRLAQTPERTDVVHDLLALLAEQMIEMNKQKQAEVKGFLTWLERKIGAKVEDFSNKTKVRAYHGHDFEALLAVLRQNHRKLKIDPDARAVQEVMEREFNRSIAKLTPLMQRIAATDRLIDLIVYRLYGLTEEEIATVEGSMSGTVSSTSGRGKV